MMRVQDHTTAALHIREQRAVENAGGRAAITEPLADAIERSYRGITQGLNAEESVAAMRSAGGFTALFETVLGEAPASDVNGLGFEQNEALIVWVLCASVWKSDIILRAKALYYERGE